MCDSVCIVSCWTCIDDVYACGNISIMFLNACQVDCDNLFKWLINNLFVHNVEIHDIIMQNFHYTLNEI